MSGQRAKTTKRNFVASLLSIFAMSLFIVLWAKPTTVLTTLDSVILVVVVDLAAYMIAYFTSSKKTGRGVIKILVYAALAAAAITYVLQPKNDLGYDYNFLFILAIEVFGMIAAYALV